MGSSCSEEKGPKYLQIVKEAYAIEKKNGNNLWQDAIQKEMENVRLHSKLYQGQEATQWVSSYQLPHCV